MAGPLARIVLVAALLAGWQAALLHPIEHVDEHGAFVHPQGGHSEDGAPLCDQLAALTACTGQAPAPCGAFQSDYQLPAASPGAPRLAEAPPFFAQGPPASA
jgi:hypothetical protein